MRIQILPLPSVMVGDDMEEPFALIVDQHDADLDQQTADEWQRFKTSAGARALLITPDTVEVVDRYAETPSPEAPTEPKAVPDSAHPIVLRDRNGNAMRMQVICSCGREMTHDWAAIDYAPEEPAKERTRIACKGCGNRLTVTIPLGGQA